MNGILQPFLVGSLAVVMSWIFSGCRWGNNVGQPLNSNPTGLYEAVATEVLYSTNARSGEVAGDPENLPQILAANISNPVALQVEDMKTGEGYLFRSDFVDEPDSALPIQVNRDNTISTDRSGSYSSFFDSDQCGSILTLEMAGRLELTRLVDEKTGIRGKMRGDFLYTEVMEEKTSGACATTRQRVYECYQNKNACGGANDAQNDYYHAELKAIYSPYIKAGAMSVEDILVVKEFSFRVKYD